MTWSDGPRLVLSPSLHVERVDRELKAAQGRGWQRPPRIRAPPSPGRGPVSRALDGRLAVRGGHRVGPVVVRVRDLLPVFVRIVGPHRQGSGPGHRYGRARPD